MAVSHDIAVSGREAKGREGSIVERLQETVAIHLGLTSSEAARRPIKIIQFGEGNFLKGFVEWIVQQLNNKGVFGGNVAVVQPRENGRVQTLEEQEGLYTVILEGLQDGQPVRSHELIDSIGKTVNPYRDWEGFLALADDPDTQIIVSNTTEAGIAVNDEDKVTDQPPAGYPAKLAHLLKRRFDRSMPGFLIMPCELIADNGPALHSALINVAERFGWDKDFIEWLDRENIFVSTLVDRIVPGYPREDAQELWEKLGYEDQNMVKAEPFLLWVVAGDQTAQRKVDELLPARKAGIDLVICDAVQPYRERKVYLLNGTHTTMAQVARLAGFKTVGQIMGDKTMRSFITREMEEEIIPVQTLPKAELENFAVAVRERFDNPFVQHSLDSIGLNSVSKFVSRLLPLVVANVEQGRGLPERIVLALSCLLWIYGGKAGDAVKIQDDQKVIDAFRKDAIEDDFVNRILSDAAIWGHDLTRVAGLAETVQSNLDSLADRGVQPLIDRLA